MTAPGCARSLRRAAAPDRAAAQAPRTGGSRDARSRCRAASCWSVAVRRSAAATARCREPPSWRRERPRSCGARSPAARAGDQRDRRRDPHQPRPRPAAADAFDALEAIGSGYSNLEYDVEARRARQPSGACRGPAAGAHRRAGGAGGQQQRGRGAAGRGGARRRARGGGLARPAGRDRRVVPDPGDPGGLGRAPGRGRHHEQDQDRGLRARDRARHRGVDAGASLELPHRRLYRGAVAAGADGAGRGATDCR